MMSATTLAVAMYALTMTPACCRTASGTVDGPTAMPRKLAGPDGGCTSRSLLHPVRARMEATRPAWEAMAGLVTAAAVVTAEPVASVATTAAESAATDFTSGGGSSMVCDVDGGTVRETVREALRLRVTVTDRVPRVGVRDDVEVAVRVGDPRLELDVAVGVGANEAVSDLRGVREKDRVPEWVAVRRVDDDGDGDRDAVPDSPSPRVRETEPLVKVLDRDAV